MNANDLLQVIEANVCHAKEQGSTSIPIANLEAYLKHLAMDVKAESEKTGAMTAIELENLKASLNQWLDEQKRAHEFRIEMLRAVISTGQAALKTALVINGGATVALLAFLGHIWSSIHAARVAPMLTYSLSLFTLGVFSAACAAGATYFSQAGYGDEFGRKSQLIGKVGHAVAVSFTLCSYGLFLWGSMKAAAILAIRV